MTSFCPIDFVQLASKEPFNYHSGLWLFLTILFSAKHNRIEDNEVDNPLEQIDFADLVNDTRSVTGFSHSSQF